MGGNHWIAPSDPLTTLDRFGTRDVGWKYPMLRMLSPRNFKTMGFGKRYKMPFGSRRDRIRILGNGVCPPVIEGVVRSLIGRARLPMAAEWGRDYPSRLSCQMVVRRIQQLNSVIKNQPTTSKLSPATSAQNSLHAPALMPRSLQLPSIPVLALRRSSIGVR